MARRPSTESEDSQKENVEPAQQKHERMKKSSGKRRVDEPNEEEDQKPHANVSDAEAERATSENDDEDGDEDGDSSPRSKKRARVNEEGDSVDVDADAEPRPSFKARGVKLQRDKDGFVPGSIVRIKLHKFLTYDDVEFRTSSHLNMILGPNGTGKSSIACAICLGLNQSPSLLGRAKEPAQYIKSGNEEGSMELELKGPVGESNIIIRRVITKLESDDKSKKQDRSKSTFFINGESVTQRAVNEAVADLGVRCGNLCTFLPQDRVAEFAKMNPKELLRATQEAAGDERLSEWHKRLIKDGKDLKEMAGSMASEEEHLQNLEARNAALEKDVKQYIERRAIERELELLDLVLPFKEYVESKAEYEKCKQKRQQLHDAAMALQDKNKPFTDFKSNLEEQHKACGKERDKLRNAAQKGFDAMSKKCAANERLQQDVEEADRKLDNLKEQERSRKDKINSLTRAIEKARNELDNPPETEDLAALEDELKSNAEALRSMNRDKGNLEDEMRTLLDESARQRVTRDRANEELKNLDNVSHRKLEELSRSDRDTADAVVWLRRNRNRFRMEVIEPAILSLSVPDSRYAASVEACFSFAQLRNFVAQCKEDYTLMNRVFNDTPEALGRKCHIAVWFRNKQENQLAQPPLSPEELLQEGFQKYAMDCVVYPDGMQWFLTREINLHRTAIALDPGRVDVRRATDMVSRLDASGQGGQASFIVGRVMNIVTRSRYGKRLPVTMTKDIRDPRNLKHPPVDQVKKAELQSRVADAQKNLEESEAQVKAFSDKLGAIEASIKDANDTKKTIQARKQSVFDVQKKLQGLEIKITNFERTLAAERSAPSVDDERQRLRKQIFDIAKKRVAIANELQDISKQVMDNITKSTRAGLQFLQIGANKKALDDLCKDRGDAYARARAKYDDANTAYTMKKVATKKLLDISKAKLHEIDDELRATFEEMEQKGDIHSKTADEFRAEQENHRARLELLTITNPGVIEQFRAREEEIAKFRDKLEKRAIKKSDLEKRLKKTRDKWYPALQELIGVIGTKFSDAFDSVGCAGEIRIAEEEDDYEAWAIEILVKFRDSEKLQLLTGTRQSGGERALTTIMYLMSLTQMARSPFSLVDEINQGMDARYERAVHNSLVDVTCREDSGQYFLITPKLLTDLKYHERMKVLCVTNGEWLPEALEDRSGDMRQMLENYVRHHRQA